MNCLHCHATTTNGLVLCELCQRHALTLLGAMPPHFRNLSRWSRPCRPNGSVGSRGSWLLRHGDASNLNTIGATLDKAGNALVTWARALSDDRGLEIPVAEGEPWSNDRERPRPVSWQQAELLCEWFADHLVSIATLEWCGQFVRDLMKHVDQLELLSETLVSGWYAGTCRQPRGIDMATGEATTCGVRTYVVPGLTWVTCDGCGATTYARDHLPAVLEEARVWVAPPKAIASAIVALMDSEQSVIRLHERIKKWEQRGRIEGIRRLDHDGDPTGPKRYSMGDVLDILGREGATRTGVRATAVPA